MQHSQQTNIHAPSGIRTHNLSRQTAIDLCLRPRDHWDRHIECVDGVNLINFDVYCFLPQKVGFFSVLRISFVNVLLLYLGRFCIVQVYGSFYDEKNP